MHTTTTIAAPVAPVWRTLTDVERWPQWLPTVTAVTWIDSGGMGVGHRARVAQPRLGTAVWTVVELRDGRSFTWVRRAPGVTTRGAHVVTEGPGGTTVTLSIEHTGPMAWLARLLSDRTTRRYIDAEARALKARCEA